MEEFEHLEERLLESTKNAKKVENEELGRDWYKRKLEDDLEKLSENIAYLRAAYEFYESGWLEEDEVIMYLKNVKNSYDNFSSTKEQIIEFNSNNRSKIDLEQVSQLEKLYDEVTDRVQKVTSQ